MFDELITILVDILLWIPRKIYEYVAEVIDFFLALLPSSGFDVQAAINGWSGDLLYFMGVFEVDYGITAIFTALTARFILRRIPVIG